MKQEQRAGKSLLSLRKLTRAVADLVREQVTTHVATLTPLLQPKRLLGAYADGATTDPQPAAARGLRDLQAAYKEAGERLGIHNDLRPPLELAAWGVDVSQYEYVHSLKSDGADAAAAADS